MESLSTFTKVLTVVPAFTNALGSVVDGIRNIGSNPPKARLEAIRKCKAESQELHEKAKEEINRMHEQAKKSAQEAEDAADQRIKQQKTRNNEEIEDLRKQIRLGEEKHEEHMKEMDREHTKKMNSLRSETNEAREKAEREHRDTMNKLDREHKEEKKQAQEKVEQARIEGERKIKAAEEEKEAVIRERQEALELYNTEMKKLVEANHQQILAITRETNQMRIENVKLKKQQLEERHALTLQQIEQETAGLVKHLTQESNRELIIQFRTILDPLYETKKSLENITTECGLPEIADGLLPPPGILEPDFDALRNERAIFQNRIHRYRQFVINTPLAHPEIVRTCNAFITRMNTTMETRDLIALTVHMPRAIDSGKLDLISSYCNVAQRLEGEIGKIHSDLNEQYEQLVLKHLNQPIDAGNNRALKDGSENQ